MASTNPSSPATTPDEDMSQEEKKIKSESSESMEDTKMEESITSPTPTLTQTSNGSSIPGDPSSQVTNPKCEPQIDTPNGSSSPSQANGKEGILGLESKSDSMKPTAVTSVTRGDSKESPPAPSSPKDPNQGRWVEQLKVLPSGQVGPLMGEVQGLRDADGRIPPRYSIHWTATTEDADKDKETSSSSKALATAGVTSSTLLIHQDDWLPSDLNSDIPPIGNVQFVLDRIQERYQTHVEQELEDHPILPRLLLYAAIEEALQTNLQQAALQEQQQQESAMGGTNMTPGSSDKLGSKSNPHPPLYYTTNPSSYLQAPTATETRPSSSSGGQSTQVIMTPASLGQRVRAGCQWANRYVVSRMPPPPVPVTTPVHQRRSQRQPKPLGGGVPQAIPLPTPVQLGGRVAQWLIEQLEQEARQATIPSPTTSSPVKTTEVSTEKRKKDKASPTKRPSPSTASQKKKKKTNPRKKEPTVVSEQDLQDVLSEEEEEESEPADDDDDYGSKDALDEAEDDDELESVERESKNTLRLSPAPKPSKKEEEDDDDDDVSGDEQPADKEESEEDIRHAIRYENPFLQPNLASLVEYLSRPKALTAEEIQKAFMKIVMRIRCNKRSCSVGLDTESLGTVDQVVLDQQTPHYPPGKVVLKAMGEETFGELQKMETTSFSRTKFVLDIIATEEAGIQTQRKQELLQQEAEFKQKKAWAKWRHKGIHEGYASWPSWYKAIGEWVEQNVTAATAETELSATEVDVPTQDDEALAKSLEEADDTTGRRRTARRAASAASEGVYYGNQSSLSQKQVQDALIRLIKVNKFQTVLRLLSLMGDDSSDPLKRCRIALGKLVWKRNLLVRKSMGSDLSDDALQKLTVEKPLLSLPPPDTDEDMKTDKAESVEPTPEEKALIDYVQHLHSTELQLRRLVTKTLAEIPVAIIATAADERPNTLESMDLDYFEDPTGIQWYTVGHELLKKVIFRPAISSGTTTDLGPCYWYNIQDYSKSIESEAEDKEEPDAKERRMRFRAVPVPPPGEEYAEQEEILILTEAQVHAGLKAAEMETKSRTKMSSDGNPFSGASGDRVTLIPVDVDDGASESEINGRIVGYDNSIPVDDDEIEYRILVLPDPKGNQAGQSFWAVLDVRADTSSYVCQPVGESNVWYSIEQFDYHSGSAAHQQCESVLTWLSRQSKAGPFAEPVDPVALNIPSYPLIVKHPMDISTMREKLESGQYSSVLPGETKGINPVSKMLNGPFRKDLELMFDNAMLFNPPDDWIYLAAAQLKKNVLKKISELCQTADQKVSATGRFRQRKSVYVDEDSDVDVYEYESENDDDFGGRGGKNRKRKRSGRGGGQKDEFSARAVEQPIRLQTTLRDASDLRGSFANLPINLSASSYSLPPQWGCRYSDSMPIADEPSEANARTKEMLELLELQKVVQANESAGLRRSTRAVDVPISSSRSKKNKSAPMEYFSKGTAGENSMSTKNPPTSRLDVEIQAELRHEDYYSKVYQQYSNSLVATEGFGAYANGSFPPYLGRVLPLSDRDEVSWEIRAPFVVPAMRWVLRGLIQSGHLSATESLGTDFSSGVIVTNDIYYFDSNLKPYEILDLRELQRKKRANREGSEESEDEVEMSEYEKARADRVARNAERLKALGLA